MKINILTLFPDFFSSFTRDSIIGRAVFDKKLEINIVNIRDFAYDKHKLTDLKPFGEETGMLLMPGPIYDALQSVGGRVLYPSPQGVTFNQSLAIELAGLEEITILCGHYEGVDERIIENYVDLEVSLGDFVLTGGELPAMVIADCVARMIPGVIKRESYENDSFFNGLLDYPHYTKPRVFNDMEVPEVLLSGHHKNIKTWQKRESLRKTLLKRPDLLENRTFTKEEKKLLDEIKKELKEKSSDI